MLAILSLILLQASASGTASIDVTSREAMLSAASNANQGMSTIGVLDIVATANATTGGTTAQAAVQALKQTASAGNPCALIQAARIERELMNDAPAASADLNRALTLGCPDARYEVATALVRANADPVIVVRALEEAVAFGDARGSTALGRLYRSGASGNGIDLDRAQQNFHRAATAGDPAGQAELAATLHARDVATPSRGVFREALYWSLVSARTGGASAAGLAREMLEKAPERLTAGQIARLRLQAERFSPRR